MKIPFVRIALSFCLLGAPAARAAIVGPYVADSATLHLWHLDETAPPCIDFASSGGVNLYGLINGATLGNPATNGFAGCLNTLGLYGYTVWTSNAPVATNFTGAGLFQSNSISATSLAYEGANGAFTMEALLCPLFPVATNFGAPAKGGTGRAGAIWQILNGESGTTSNRIWQWRFDPVGTVTNTTIFPSPGTNASPLLDFIGFDTTNGGTRELYAVIPTNGPNAIASNQWFHVAVTYSGTSNTAGNFNFYWTAMNPTNTTANLILSTNLSNSLATPSAQPNFCIGNSGRGDTGNWLGMIDEVRMSSVARSATGMMFAPSSITLTPLMNVSTAAGATITLNVPISYSGANPLTIQWFWNGTNITGATAPNISGYNTNTLVISSITGNQGGTYMMVATDGLAVTNSTSCNVGVGLNVSPLANQLVGAGSTVTLSAVATGPGTLGYQWLYDGTAITSGNSSNISGYNMSALVITNIAYSQAGTYTLVVTAGSSSNTTSAVITVWAPVANLFDTGINNDGSLVQGGFVDPHWTLVESPDPTYTGPSAIVDSTIPPNYLANSLTSQWLSPGDNALVAGGLYQYATSFYLDSENLTNMQLIVNWGANNVCEDILLNGVDLNITDGNGFSVLQPTLISNNFVTGSNYLVCVISNSTAVPKVSAFRAELAGLSAPLASPTAVQILGAPIGVTNFEGQSASFTVSAYGSGPITYQWYFGATQLSGQTNHILTLTNLQPSEAGTYTVQVANSLSTNSPAAVLAVLVPDTLEWQGYLNAEWDLSTTNWLDTTISAQVAFSQFADVVFDNNGSGQPSINLDIPLTPSAVTVTANNNYTFNGNGGYLAGNFNLLMNGPGTLIMDAPNTYSGTTIIQGGTLQVGNFDANGTLGSSAVSNNASLVFTRVDTFTFSNQLSGQGSVVMNGTGTLIVTGTNATFTGPTEVTQGTLTPRNTFALGIGTNVTSVLDGAQLAIDQNINLPTQPIIFGGIGNGNGGLYKSGAGTTTLGGPITLSDNAGIGLAASSSLVLTNPASITGTNVNLAEQGAGASMCVVDGALNLGSGSITTYNTASGTSTLVLASLSNVWTGGTIINGSSAVQIGDGKNDGSIGTGAITDNGTLTFLTSNNFVMSIPVTGGGIFNQSGAGRLVLQGAPLGSFGGAIHINGNGQLQLAPGESLSSGSLTIGAAQTDTNRLELTGSNSVSLGISIVPRAYMGTLTSTTPPTNYPSIVNLAGTNTVQPSSPVLVPTGGNLFAIESDSGYLIFNGGVTAGGNGRFFALQGPGSGEVDGSLNENSGTLLFVYVLGSGSWTFNGSSSYVGMTTISNGTMVVNGTIATSPITAYGGTLGGIGILTGTVTIGAGATLAPTLATGPSTPLGTLTIDSDLTLQPGSTTALRISKTALASDQIAGLTSVTYGGTLVVSNLSGSLALGDVFTLFPGTSYTNNFSTFVLPPLGSGLGWSTTNLPVDGTLHVVAATTASSPTIRSAVLSGTNVIFSGTGGTAGLSFSVLSSTLVSTPLTNWTVVASGHFDGSGDFTATNGVSAGAPQTYFVLRTP